MRNTKTKIKFTDIAGMLDRDEMKVIVGGSGATGGGGATFCSGTALGGGGSMGGSSQSSFDGSSYSYAGSTSSYLGNGVSSSSGSSTGTGSSSSSNSSGWNNNSGGLSTTSDPVAISRFYDLYVLNNGNLTTSQVNTFVTNESTAAGQTANNLQLYGTVLNTVVIINNYHGPSTIPQGIVINNGTILNSPFGNGGSIGSSPFSSYLQQGIPKTDCFFQCLGWISQMNGDTAHDANYYASVYAFTHPNTSVIPNFNLSSFNKPSTNGMPLDQASSFAGVFFKATDYSGASNQFLEKFINPSTNPSGEHQLIGVYRTPTGGLHAIAITSISGPTVNFYDPQNGNSDSRNMTQFESFYGITAHN
jgi:hypothetical protein